jgi:hypothetical protein
MTRPFAALLAAAALLFATGVWWGVPDYHTWAPDEIIPSDVLAAARARFADGWTSIYPPLHYMVLSALYLPIQQSVHAGLVPLDHVQSLGAMMIVGRLLTVAMALAMIVCVYRVTTEAFDARAGLLAAAMVTTTLPVTYYAKTVNLDVPYTFWFTTSLLFYARTFRSAEASNFYIFALLGTFAICTKDQAFGFYVLPAAYMTIGRVVRRSAPGVPAPRVLLGMVALCVVTVMIAFNIPMNTSGFMAHVRLITGEPSGNYRMFESDVAGQVQLAGAVFVQFCRAMSWPLALAASVGVVATLVSARRASLPFILPLVSYYGSFLAVVGYVYDRFLIGPIIVIAVLAAPALVTWMGRVGDTFFTPRRLALSAMLAYAASRGVALDYLMIHDSRYATERWLEAHASMATVAGVGRAEQLPRQSRMPWRGLNPDVEELAALQPDIVVVNGAFRRRPNPGLEAREFYDTLQSGRGGYRLVERFRTSRQGLPLAFEARFIRAAEDPFSNLPKINPPLEIYVSARGLRIGRHEPLRSGADPARRSGALRSSRRPIGRWASEDPGAGAWRFVHPLARRSLARLTRVPPGRVPHPERTFPRRSALPRAADPSATPQGTPPHALPEFSPEAHLRNER